MADNDILLMAHLMRRAGFGASYEELERRAAKGYEATVEELLYPEAQPDLKMDVMNRYMHGWRDMNGLMANQGLWTYRIGQLPSSVGREDVPVLAQHLLRRGLQVHESQADSASVEQVPRPRLWQVLRPDVGPGYRPGHALLPGQSAEP